MRERRLGRYVLGDVLGTGGMGVVYRARDADLGRDVAVKVLDAASPSIDPGAVERFQREARAAAALRHPHIVAVHDVGRDGDVYYFTMDLVRGRTADALRPMAPRRAAEVVRDAARAVQYAHAQGVLHRDLKPSNIIVSDDGAALVMDFGLSRKITDSTPRLTVTGEIFGTPHYMSAEQASGGDIDARSDVWGLGATLYALLAGRAPFDGGEVFDVLSRVVRDDPPPIGGTAPPELEAVAMKCMEKRSEARYASAAALAEDLENWLAGRAVGARPVGYLSRFGRRARRNPALTSVAVLALVAVAVAGGFAGARALDAAEERDRARAALAEGRLDDAVRHYERAQALWTDRDAELAAAVGAARRSLAEEDRRQALTAAYFDLHDAALGLIEEAEARARPPGELAADFDALVADWRRDHPGDYPFVESLKGWIQFLAGDEEAGEDRIEADAVDPIARLYRGRVHLTQAMRCLGGHRLNFGTKAVDMSVEFPPQMRELLDLASSDFRYVAESGVFGSLRRRREIEAQVEGLRAIAEGRYADAIDDLREMERLPGLRRDSLRAQGIAAIVEGRWRDAADLLDRICAMRGSSSMDRFLLGEALLGLSMTQPPDAVDVLGRAADVFTDGIRHGEQEVSFRMGRAAVRSILAGFADAASEDGGRLRREALVDIDRAIELSPNDPGLRLNRGTMRCDLAWWTWAKGRDPAADFDLAEADFRAVARAMPELTLLYDNLSLLYIRRSQWEAAVGLDPTPSLRRCVKALDELVTRMPSNAEGWFRRGEAHVNLGGVLRAYGQDPTAEMEAALGDFIECLRLDPARDYAAFGAANLNFELGRLDRAAELYERAIDIGPPDASTHANLGLVRTRLGDRAGALEQYDRAVAIDPAYWRAHIGRGEVLAALGRTAEAREALEAALRIVPDEPTAQRMLRALPDTDF